MPSKPCVSCSRSVPIFSGGRCHHCAAEWGAANGLSGDQMPQPCPVEGCDSYVMRRGYCDRHYRRFIDHGTTDKTRVVNQERLHPEYRNWIWLRRQGRLCEAWQQFHIYIEAIGERPSPRHWLERPDDAKLYGPDNFIWRAPTLDREYDLKTREGRQEYQRDIRALKPRYWVGSGLKRFFGITREQYDEMLAKQSGGCAICRQTEIEASGRDRLLSVDHRHSDSEIRGLLCHGCNVSIGHFNDDPALLRRAAEYLERPGAGLFAPKAGEPMSDDRRRSHFTLRADGVCSEEGCDGIIKARGLCAAHYARLKRNGSTQSMRVRATCTIDTCGRAAVGRGLCHKHYEAAHRRGFAEPEAKAPITCVIDGCDAPHTAHGYCEMHYRRWKRHGSAGIVHDSRGNTLTAPDMRTE